MSSAEVVGPLFSLLALFAGSLGIVAVVLRHKRAVRELLSRERLAALDKGVEIPWGGGSAGAAGSRPTPPRR